MATTPQRGAGMGLPLAPLYGNNNRRSIPAGTYHICPGGQYYISLDAYTQVEALDPITGTWENISPIANSTIFVNSDGVNIRISNRTGTPVGAFMTNCGSGYTSQPTITPSAGGSTWSAVIGGAITISVVSAGAGYNYQPQVIVAAPAVGGIPATAFANLSGGVISTVTVINQGGGYATLPTIAVVADPREATATTPGPTTTPVLSAVAAGAGLVTGLLMTNPGSAVTGVPTLTISGGGAGTNASALVVMDTTVTGFTATSAGAGYANATAFDVITGGGLVSQATTGAIVNPALSVSAYTPRQASILGTTTASGTLTATGAVVVDGGRVQAVPTAFVLPSGTAVPTSGGVLTPTLGGVTGYYILQPV